jgi:hypothetical protein
MPKNINFTEDELRAAVETVRHAIEMKDYECAAMVGIEIIVSGLVDLKHIKEILELLERRDR